MPLNVTQLRADTGGAGKVTHFNNAGSSLMPRQVTDAVVGHLRREEEIGGYEAAAAAAPNLDRVRVSLAQLIGANPGDIALTESGSNAWAAAISALSLTAPRVLLARTEYAGNVLALRRLARQRNLQLTVLEDDDGGRPSVAHLQQELATGDVGLVALTHVPMPGGPVNPAAEFGSLCRDAGVSLVLDACQSVGQMPLNVAELKCDILVGTGRKFLRGPRGTAFAYVNLDLPGLEARPLESREASMAGRLGLGRAVDYALELGVEVIQDRILKLAGIMYARLAELPGVELHTEPEHGIMTFSVRNKTPAQVQQHLALERINVSMVQLPPSTPDAVLSATLEDEPTAVRASVHCFNTEAEIDRLVEVLTQLQRTNR
ncbi:aminotransferase class V-fold PLP-dependent enzyme [Arthrobacter tecti]